VKITVEIPSFVIKESLERANVAELVDALDLGSSGVTRESSSLSIRMQDTLNSYRGA
jgi:hypothetical protein